MRSLWVLAVILGALLMSVISVNADEAWYGIVEAESMRISSGWQVAAGREGYFPAEPNTWSGNRLRAGSDHLPAVAEQEIDVPASGRYALWVRYESPCSFDTSFAVDVLQNGKKAFSGTFGGKNDLKYFPNGRGWKLQAPWLHHNTDFVYQRGEAALSKGRATVVLKKDINGSPAAARIVDFICLTSDLTMEPGNEYFDWRENPRVSQLPPIISRCVQPTYLRLRVPAASGMPAEVSLLYTDWEYYGWRGPSRSFIFSSSGLRRQASPGRLEPQGTANWSAKVTFKEDERLPAGYDSGWVGLELSRRRPASIRVLANEPVELSISLDPSGKDAVSFNLAKGVRELLVSTGNGHIEDAMLGGRKAIFHSDYFKALTSELERMQVPGRRARRFGILATGMIGDIDMFDTRRLAAATGVNGVWGWSQPSVYSAEGEAYGFNRSMGYQPLQNNHLKRECYEGDYSKLEKSYRQAMDALQKQGLGNMPQNSKMIEEAGPPALATLRTYKGINERFRQYLQAEGVKPVQVLPRAVLAEAVRGGKTDEGALWNMVALGEGTPQEAADNPVLFYHSKIFGSHVFVDNCARATSIFEKVFPKGSVANSGAFYPQDGHGVRRNWYDEFMLFRERGFTAYHSEMTWGQCNLPYYIGPQTESYQGTLGRGLAKYHDIPTGSYMLASSTYGYNGDYVETAGYAMASHGFQWLNYYGWHVFNTFTNSPEIYKAIKRFSWSIGAVEDNLLNAKVVPARVALGWSETTAIWDQAEAPYPGFLPPGNVMYALERHYLYLLLRHLQIPVDLLSEADIAEGRLKDYQVYFMVGDHMNGNAAAALKKWVGEGGTLVSAAGGGLWNEYNHPAGVLNEVYGISGVQTESEGDKDFLPGIDNVPAVKENRLVKEAQALRAKMELIHAQPIDEIAMDGSAGKLPVMGYRQGFKAAGGRVLGTFRNKEAAVVANNYGKGKALIMGFLPGIGYLYKAFPMVPYGRGGEDLSMYLYPDYKPLVREAVGVMLKEVWPGMGAAVTCSSPYVEANLMKDKSGRYHIALVNYSGRRIDRLQVSIKQAEANGAKGAKTTFGKAETKINGGIITVTMPLDKFDWLTLE